jgi:hypothetical protein
VSSAADAFAHQIAAEAMLQRQTFSPTETVGHADASVLDGLWTANQQANDASYLQALRQLASGSLSPAQIYLAVNLAHLAFRSGLPFRDMTRADYGLVRGDKNKPFSQLKEVDREKSFSLVRKAAQLILAHLQLLEDRQHQQSSPTWDVFLGGSCNPTTWRRDIAIPKLTAAGRTFYNPQVENWTADLIEIEARAKASAGLLIFVIDNKTRGLASMLEASEYIAAGRRVLLCVNFVEPGSVIQQSAVDDNEAQDLNRARQYLLEVAKRHGVRTYASIPDLVDAAVAMLSDRR